MKKILKIISLITLLSATSINSISFTTINKNEIEDKDYLDEKLEETDLGEFSQVNEKNILLRVEELNPWIFIDELNVVDINNDSARIIAKKDSIHYYVDPIGVFVTFKVKEIISLKDVIKQTNLGEIENKKNTTILAAIKVKNPDIDTNKIIVKENDITDVSAIITGSSNGIYQGEVLVRYTLGPISLLDKTSNVIQKTDLGFFTNPNTELIKEKIAKLNPNLKMSEIKLYKFNLSAKTYIITAKTSSKVYKQNEKVTFTFSYPSYSLSKIFATSNNIGEIKNTYTSTIKERLEELGINTEEIEIRDTTIAGFWIQAKQNSETYIFEDWIKLYFKLPPKSNLQNTIGNFQWIVNPNDTKTDILNKIASTINREIGNGISLQNHYTVDGEQWSGLGNNSKVGIRKLKVSAKSNSTKLSGSVDISIIDKLDLNKVFSSSQKKITAKKSQINLPNTKFPEPLEYAYSIIDEYVKTEKIFDFDSDYKSMISIAKSRISNIDEIYTYNKTKDFEFYSKVIFEVLNKEKLSFKTGRSTLIFAAPDYDENDDFNFLLDKTKFTTVIDSGDYTDYPYLNQYTNKRSGDGKFRALGNVWNTSENALTLATINVESLFNFNNIDEFFNKYNIKLNFKFNHNFLFLPRPKEREWKYNYWNDPRRVPTNFWKSYTMFFHKNKPFGTKSIEGMDLKKGLEYFGDISDSDHENFDYPIPPLKQSIYLYGGVHVWMEKSANNKVIYLKAETGNYFTTHWYVILVAYTNFMANSIALVKA